jgi:hypothetical protein
MLALSAEGAIESAFAVARRGFGHMCLHLKWPALNNSHNMSRRPNLHGTLTPQPLTKADFGTDTPYIQRIDTYLCTV